MSNDINLLLHKPITLSKSFTRRVKLIRLVALLLLFTVPTGTIILFLLIFFSPLPSLQQKEKDLLTSANIIRQKTASVAFINERVMNSVQFIAPRSIYRKALQESISSLPSGVTINTLDMESDKMTLIAVSPSLSLLKTYQGNLTGIQGAGQVLHAIKFQSVMLTQSEAMYQMTLTADIHE